MNTETQAAPEKARKVNRLTDVTVEVDPPHMYGCRTPEQRAQALERWVRDFNDFIRDHRSQDEARLHVMRKHEDVCSVCNGTWDMASEDGVAYCGNCGAEVSHV